MPGNLSIAALAERVKGLGGWRRRAAAVVAGAASVLALAPFFVWPILWITLPALVWLIDGAIERGTPDAGRTLVCGGPPLRPPRSAGGSGSAISSPACSGSAKPSSSRPRVFAVLMPFAVLLMPAGLALFYAAATALAAPFWRTGIYRVLALALSLSAMEWLRGHVLSGFPWNVLGLRPHLSRCRSCRARPSSASTG